MAALALACGVATIPLVTIGMRHDAADTIGEWLFATFTPGFVVAGWWLLSRRPGMWIGRIYLGAGLSTAVAGLAAGYAAAIFPDRAPGVTWAMWIVSVTWPIHGAAMSVAMLLFPRARPRGPLDRWLIGVGGVGLTVLQLVATAVRPGLIVTTPDHPDGAPAGVRNPLGIDALDGLVGVVDGLVFVLGVAFTLVTMIVIAVRWKRSEGIERRQYRWAFVLTAVWFVVMPVVLSVPGDLGPFLAILATLGFQLLVVVAILRWDVYEARVVLRRSALAAALLAAALGVYGAVVGVAALFVGGFGPGPATLGAMAAVFTFGPLSTRIRRAVDRVFYGRSHEPFELLAALGREQAAAADPDDALDRLVTAIGSELRLPAVVLEDRDGAVLSAAGDGDLDDADVVPLEHLGRRVGRLLVAPRRGTSGLTEGERQLTASLAAATAAVVAYREAAVDLEAAKDEVEASRDAERRRYQRDLHDGLGPRLTAVAFRLDAASNHLRAGRPEAAARLLDDARGELTTGVDEIRSYIHALANPTLAVAGLRRVLSDRIERMSADADVTATVHIGRLGELPESMQSAIVAVVSEAFTNVVRHAQAERCTIELARVDGHVHLTVTDDGRGIDDRSEPGVGLRSMRHRVEELHGTFEVGRRGTGTVVSCSLPVPS
ncbi:MAG: histidine kinase [Acidimicrobiales bacterium]